VQERPQVAVPARDPTPAAVGTGIARLSRMNGVARQWMQVLEERFGVRREFAGHLMPLLEKLAAQQPSVEEWDQMLHGIAAAYRAGRVEGRRHDSEGEVRLLVDQCSAEMQKLEEAMKVLGVCLERLDRRLDAPGTTVARLLH